MGENVIKRKKKHPKQEAKQTQPSYIINRKFCKNITEFTRNPLQKSTKLASTPTPQKMWEKMHKKNS